MKHAVERKLKTFMRAVVSKNYSPFERAIGIDRSLEVRRVC